ncbi:MAG: LysR family transcriptional regulator [Gammaproteobacteria bacterium]|nr:LysR family transcriptional regulator [Gammaproteobacteria bacterium]
MKHTKMPINWLRAFEVAARHLSLSAAASELNVTPAAVSQQVRLLELRLGERLFVRHARGLRLTLAGEALITPCRESFERLDTALVELFGNRGRQQLVIRVSLGFARQWVLDKLAGFTREHPDIPIRLVATVWAGELLDPSVDVDIRIASGPSAGMESHQLTHDDVFPVCSPTLAMGTPRLRHPTDLRHHTLLTTVGFAQGWPHWFAAAGIKRESSAVSLEFDSMRLALEMAALGHGVTLARSSYVEDLLRARRLKRLFKVGITATDNVYLTLAHGLGTNSPAVLFREWIVGKPAGGMRGNPRSLSARGAPILRARTTPFAHSK